MIKTIEQKAYEVLSNDYYTLNIAGEKLKFRYATLDDLQKIGSLASVLPDINREATDPEQVFQSFKYAKQLRNIIAVTLFIESKNNPLSFFKRRKSLKKIEKVKIMEVWGLIQAILKNNHVFFYLDIIASLKGTNMLKPTQGMNLTARGR